MWLITNVIHHIKILKEVRNFRIVVRMYGR